MPIRLGPPSTPPPRTSTHPFTQPHAVEVSDGLLVASGTTSARSASGWASLTRTDENVIEEVRLGFTNPQIADRLLMRRETVKTHLSHVYAKLGVANRTELAALAARADH